MTSSPPPSGTAPGRAETARGRGLAWTGWAGGALTVSATIVAFLPVLRNDFVTWDDLINLLDNPHYRGLGWANLRWMFTTTLLGHYVPLTWLSFAINFVLGGLDPRGYHLGNLLLHAASAGVFYLVARRLLAVGFAGGVAMPEARDLRDPTLAAGAACAALVFGVHPLRVESVAWATERRDVLCGLFYLLAALAYLRGVERGGAIKTRSWALSILAFLLSLLSKAASVPLPVALLLLDVYPLRRVRAVGWRRILVEKVPYLVLAGLAGIAALIAQSEAGALMSFQSYAPVGRLTTVGYTVTFYPRKFLWATDLSPYYAVPATLEPLSPRYVVPTVALVLVTVVLVALRRRWPAALAAWVYSALLVLPVSGIAQAGSQLVADRYSYFSGFGFALLPGAGLVWVLRARGRLRPAVVGACVAGCALVIGGLGAGAWRQSTFWLDTGTLWRRAIAVEPDNARAHIGLAYWLVLTERYEQARAEYEHALTMTENPHLKGAAIAGIADSWTRQGIAAARRGDPRRAVDLLSQALRTVPGYPAACGSLRNLGATTHVAAEDLASCPDTAAGRAGSG